MRKRRLAEEDDGEDSEDGAVKGDHPTDQARNTRTSKLKMSKHKNDKKRRDGSFSELSKLSKFIRFTCSKIM